MPKKGYKQTEEHKRKIGLTSKGRVMPPRTEEHRKKLGLAHKGIKLSEEIKKKIGLANSGKRHWNYGKHWSDEAKEKMRVKQVGKKKNISDEVRRGMCEKAKNNKRSLGKHWNLSEETRRKISNSHKGEKSYLWRGGISSVNTRIRLGVDFGLWRKRVFERDKYVCQKYGLKAVKGTGKRVILHPHHIKNFSDFPELRFEVSNGITLSEKAHKEFHKKYGVKNNTQKQLEEFLCRPLMNQNYPEKFQKNILS